MIMGFEVQEAVPKEVVDQPAGRWDEVSQFHVEAGLLEQPKDAKVHNEPQPTDQAVDDQLAKTFAL